MPPLANTHRLTRCALLALSVLVFSVTGCGHRAPARPLYQELGGVQGINAISAAMLQRMSSDPRTQRSFDGINLKTLSASLAAHLCQIADGPCPYDGETMKNAHADLHITGSEFEVTVQILRDELDRAGVSTGAKNELLRRLAPMQRDIVTSDR